jgi:hypothetical protein
MAPSTTPDTRPRDIVTSTARTLHKVLLNSVLSVAFAWLFAFCCSAGNAFSNRTPKLQSFEEFLVAKMLWFHGFFGAATLSIFVSLLLTEQLAGSSVSGSAAVYWLKRLGRQISPYFVVVGLSVVGGCVVLSRVLEESSRAKACAYFTLLCFYAFVVFTEAQTRHLFRTETVRGQARTLQQTKRMQRYPTTNQSSKPSSPSRRRFLRAILHDLPLMLSALFATTYVHVVSTITIVHQWDLALFTVCSVSLKLILQEIAKHFLTKKRRTPNMRLMAITVAAPTILVDTQLRTVLLCQDNASMTVMGSLLLALAEVCIRMARTIYVQWLVGRVVSRSPHQAIAPVVAPRAKKAAQISQIHVAPVRRTSSLSIIDPTQDRVHLLLALHAAEVYADMYAEYIAMGCSYGILLFFGAHPKYQLSGSSSHTSASGWTNASVTGLQLGVEVVVDVVACALEIRRGIDFEQFNQEHAFLSVFVVAIALVNVHISSGIYLRG